MAKTQDFATVAEALACASNALLDAGNAIIEAQWLLAGEDIHPYTARCLRSRLEVLSSQIDAATGIIIKLEQEGE